MSYFTHHKRKTTRKSILAVLALTICAFALMAAPARADPQKKVDEAVQTIDGKTEQAKDADTEQLALPQADDKDEGMIKTEPGLPETPEVIVPEIKMETPASKEPADYTTPVQGAAVPAPDKAQPCYKQENGVTECICEDSKACAKLASSDICQAGTNWQNDEGSGGCTKKSE